MKKLLIILATILSLLSFKAEASYTPPNSVTFPISIANGGTAATTAQGALNNLNMGGDNTAAYVVAQCTGFNDQTPLENAATAAYNAFTSVLLPPGAPFGNPLHGCQTDNTFVQGVPYVDFYMWGSHPSESPDAIYVGGSPSKEPSIYTVNGYSITSTAGYSTPYCLWDLRSNLYMSFHGINLIGDNAGFNGTVAFCNSTGFASQEQVVSMTDSSYARIPNVFGCSLTVPVAATGTYTFTTNPTNSQTIILDGTTWTFVTSGATGNQTNIQGTAALTVAQLATDLNASTNANIFKATYSSGTSGSLVLTITYKTTLLQTFSPAPTGSTTWGSAGNFYTLAAGTYGGTVSGTDLTGGVDGGQCALYGTGNNYLEVRSTHSSYNQVGWVAKGFLDDMFFNNTQSYSVYGFLSGFQNTGGGNDLGWKVIDTRLDQVGEGSYGGYGSFDFGGVVRALIVGLDVNHTTSSQPLLWFRGNYGNITISGLSINQYGGAPVVIGSQTINEDAMAVFSSASSGTNGPVIISTGAISGGNTYANYLVRFDGLFDNNIYMSGLGASPNIAPVLYNTETPKIFNFDNPGMPLVSLGRTIGLGTTTPQAGFDASGQLTAYLPPLIAPLGSQTPLTVESIVNNSIPTSGNVDYYKFDENTGTSLSDSTGNGHTGTFNGTTGSQWVTGIVNSGLSFDGTDNFVSTSYTFVGGTSARAMSMWFNTTQNTCSCPTNNMPDLLIYGSGAGQFALGLNLVPVFSAPVVNGVSVAANGGNITFSPPSGKNIYDGNWHHLVMNIPASATLANLQFYIDGVLLTTVKQSQNPSSAINTSSGNVAFGTGFDGAATFYSGKLDEIGLWNRTLTSSEVALLYNSGLANQYPYAATGTQTANLINITTQNGTSVLTGFNGLGYLGIGTTAPTGPLQVVGLGTSAPIGTTGAGALCIDSNNTVYKKLSGACP